VKKKIIISLAILVFLSLGSTLLGDPYVVDVYGLDNLTLIGTWTGNDNDLSQINALTGLSLTWAGGTYTDSQLVAPTGATSGYLVWNGTGIVTHIALKAGNFYTLYALTSYLDSPGDSQEIVQDQILNNPGNAFLGISHATGFNDGTSVPEPATLMLLGLGLIAVPLTKKLTL